MDGEREGEGRRGKGRGKGRGTEGEGRGGRGVGVGKQWCSILHKLSLHTYTLPSMADMWSVKRTEL